MEEITITVTYYKICRNCKFSKSNQGGCDKERGDNYSCEGWLPDNSYLEELSEKYGFDLIEDDFYVVRLSDETKDESK